MGIVFWGVRLMISVFKWWWAWDSDKIEDWLERMEAGGLRLVETRFIGLYFCFERCNPTKARYCIDFQSKLTPDYITIINDDGWKLYQVKMGWYILRKEYQEERPDLYTDYQGLITRNKFLLTLMIVGLLIEILCFGNIIWNTYKFPSNNHIAQISILGSLVLAFFSFGITSLAMQIRNFSKKD